MNVVTLWESKERDSERGRVKDISVRVCLRWCWRGAENEQTDSDKTGLIIQQ